MIDEQSPQSIRDAYKNARLKIERARSEAQFFALNDEVANISWFENILETAARLVGPHGMDIVQARGMFRALNDCEPSSPAEVAKAIDAFAEAVMNDARNRLKS